MSRRDDRPPQPRRHRRAGPRRGVARSIATRSAPAVSDAGAAAGARRDDGLRRAPQHQDRADRAARRALADRRASSSAIPPAASIISATRSTTSPRRAATLARARRARPRRRRAEDRRARQAGAVPPSEGFPRHADRAGAGVKRMRIGTLDRHLFRRLVDRAVRRPAVAACAAQEEAGEVTLGTDARARRPGRCSFARRSRRSIVAAIVVGGVLAGGRRASALEPRSASPTASSSPQAIKKARPFGLASSSSASYPFVLHPWPNWLVGLISRAQRQQPLTARPKGSSSQDLDRDAFLLGRSPRSALPSPCYEKTLAKLGGLVTNLCAWRPKFLHESAFGAKWFRGNPLEFRGLRRAPCAAVHGPKGLVFS